MLAAVPIKVNRYGMRSNVLKYWNFTFVFQVEEVFVHPDYDPETVDNDVALLRLPEAIKLGHQGIRLACLPQPGQSLPITQKCTIIGWGKERSSHVFGTEVLHEAEVTGEGSHQIRIQCRQKCSSMYLLWKKIYIYFFFFLAFPRFL